MGDAPEAGRTAARGRRGKRESHSRRAERRKAFFFRGESGTGTRVLPQPGRKEREEERGLQASRPPPPLLVRTGSLRFTVTDPSRSRRRQRGGGGPAAWEGFFSAMGNLLFRGGGELSEGKIGWRQQRLTGESCGRSPRHRSLGPVSFHGKGRRRAAAAAKALPSVGG